MTGTDMEWDRLMALLDAMTDEEIEALRLRGDRDPKALSLDEAGMLFLLTRDKIRKCEAKAKRRDEKGGGSPEREN